MKSLEKLLFEIPARITKNDIPMYFTLEKHISNTEFWASYKTFDDLHQNITGVGKNPTLALLDLMDKI